MEEILKKLGEVDRCAIERTLETLREEEKFLPHTKNICEHLRWRIYGMADILLLHQIISAEDYVVLSQSSKW